MTFEDLTPEEQAEIKEREARAQKQLEVDFVDIMATAGGRRFMWALIGSCHAFHPIFDVDHAVMCLKEGRRNVGLEMIQRINALCPDQYQVMVRENTVYTSEEK